MAKQVSAFKNTTFGGKFKRGHVTFTKARRFFEATTKDGEDITVYFKRLNLYIFRRKFEKFEMLIVFV